MCRKHREPSQRVISKFKEISNNRASARIIFLTAAALSTGIGALVVWMFIAGVPALPGVGSTAPNEPRFLKDCAACPQLVIIPAGTFEMGAGADDQGDGVPYELPQHRVRVASIALGKTEVTRGEFAAFVRDAGYQAPGCRIWNGVKWQQENSRSWESPGFEQDDLHPAACIAWKDAKAYTEWLSRKTGIAYRLPSEAEWEYAARAGTASPRFWGTSSTQACRFANVADKTSYDRVLRFSDRDSHACSDGYEYTAPVASFVANAFGLHDMIGNVWEWTADCWHPSYDSVANGAEPSTNTDCDKHAFRGGSWISRPSTARSAVRFWDFDLIRGDGRGFRVARSLP